MIRAKTITKSGASPTQEEIAAANVVAAAFKDRKFGIFPMTVNGVTVEYDAFKGIATVSSGQSYFYSALIPQKQARKLHIGLTPSTPAFKPGDGVGIAYLTDGTILATWPTKNTILNSNYIGMPKDEWPGGSSIQLYNSTNGLVSKGDVIQLVIPEDVGLPVQPTPLVADEAYDRFRMFGLICTAEIIADLEAGKISDELNYLLKVEHPVSSNLSLPVLPSIQVSQMVLSGTNGAELMGNPPIGQTYAVTYQRDTVISYTKPDGTVQTEAFTGTFQYEAKSHSSPDGYASTITSYSLIFNGQYIDIDPSSGFIYNNPINTGPLYGYKTTFLADKNVMNGQLSFAAYGEGEIFHVENTGNTGYIFEGALINSQDMLGNQIVPPLKYDVFGYIEWIATALDKPLTFKTIPIFEQFRTDIKPIYDPDVTNTSAWLDSSLTDKETVTIYPLQFTSSTKGDLGLNPQVADKSSITGIYLTKGYVFKYAATDGSFSFHGVKPIKDLRTGLVSERIDFQSNGKNEVTLKQLLDRFGFTTVEQLYALYKVTTEAAFLALFHKATLQEVINLIRPPSIFPNLLIKSSRGNTGWRDVDKFYTDQNKKYEPLSPNSTGIKGAFNPDMITLEGVCDFLG